MPTKRVLFSLATSPRLTALPVSAASRLLLDANRPRTATTLGEAKSGVGGFTVLILRQRKELAKLFRRPQPAVDVVAMKGGTL